MGRGCLVLGSRRGVQHASSLFLSERTPCILGRVILWGGSVYCAMKNVEYHAPEYKFLYHNMLADSRFRV